MQFFRLSDIFFNHNGNYYMNLPQIYNQLFDKKNNTHYKIYAGRKLFKKEMIRAVKSYLFVKNIKVMPSDKKITIYYITG